MEVILIIDDEDYIRDELGSILESETRELLYASNGREALDILQTEKVDMALTDVRMPVMDGFEFIEKAKSLFPRLPIVTITAYASTETAIRALRLGAYDFITKPFSIDEVRNVVGHALLAQKLFNEIHYLRARLNKEYSLDNIIGQSPVMQKLFDIATRVSKSPCSVFLVGESGTGKDLVAQAIHHHSDRSQERFVPINCGSIPEGLLESELFGHVKGSFTGAIADKEGLVQAANGGTLFLDEIGDMPLSLQVKLLRLIQNKEIQKVGSTETLPVDVRIIAATHHDIASRIKAGAFRQDLYYRINVVEIEVPPLRDRQGDLSLLVNRFLKHYSETLKKNVVKISSEVRRVFLKYNWPGNVRELQNAIERAVALCEGDTVELGDLPRVFESIMSKGSIFSGTLSERLANFESKCIESSIEDNGHDLEGVSKELGVSLATLYRKMKKIKVDASSQKIVEIPVATETFQDENYSFL